MSRQKTIGTNKNSIAQRKRRAIFAAAASAYKALGSVRAVYLDDQRKLHPTTDSLGKKITLTNYAYWLQRFLRGDRLAYTELPTEWAAAAILQTLNARALNNYPVMLEVERNLTADEINILGRSAKKWKAVNRNGQVFAGDTFGVRQPNIVAFYTNPALATMPDYYWHFYLYDDAGRILVDYNAETQTIKYIGE